MIAVVFLLVLLGVTVASALAGGGAAPVFEIVVLIGVMLMFFGSGIYIGAALGVLGLIVAFLGLKDVSKYENFLLVISYWIGPWLGVYLTDWYLRRRHQVAGFLFDRQHRPLAFLERQAITERPGQHQDVA